MNDKEVGQYWNNNAEAWTILSSAGYDLYRDYLNTPAFFEKLPDINGMYGIDLGCGDGHNTRLLAKRGAKVEAIDIAEAFIQAALAAENNSDIHYQVASAVKLSYQNNTFDFATAFMSFMDIPDTEQAIKEAFRVLKPNGFLQFSISHPCFNTPHRKNLRNPEGKTYAIEVGGYFKELNGAVEEWVFKAPPDLISTLPPFKIPRFTRTLSQWVNILVAAGFVIEMVNEPYPDDEVVEKQPALQDAQVIAYFLHIRCRKL